MNKKIGLMAFLLIGMSFASASLGNCDVNGDNEINIVDFAYIGKIQGWYQSQDMRFDLNSDDEVNLADLSIYGTNHQTEGWCHNEFWNKLQPEEQTSSDDEHPTSNHKSPYPNLHNKVYITMTLTDYPQQFRVDKERYYVAYQGNKLVVGEWKFYKTILKRTTFEEIGVEYELERVSRHKPTKWWPEVVKVKLTMEEIIDA
jgi:hypothetical protein